MSYRCGFNTDSIEQVCYQQDSGGSGSGISSTTFFIFLLSVGIVLAICFYYCSRVDYEEQVYHPRGFRSSRRTYGTYAVARPIPASAPSSSSIPAAADGYPGNACSTGGGDWEGLDAAIRASEATAAAEARLRAESQADVADTPAVETDGEDEDGEGRRR